MKLLVCLVALFSCTLAVSMDLSTQARHLNSDVDTGKPMEHLFSTFKQIHNRKYEDDNEESMRYEIFKLNVNHIRAHNILYAKGQKSYYLGVNQFSDLTHQEFLKLYTGHIRRAKESTINASTYLPPFNILLPEKVDWRKEGIVTKVKNQKQCGSCWAFSATGSLEGQHAKKTEKLISLSEQQLVDCSGEFGNQGCNGGLMDQAFKYIKAVGGIEDEEDYPYEAKESVCKFDTSKIKATVSGYVDVTKGDESALQSAVATIGPISVAIDASHPSFQSYTGGVYDEPECSSSQLDHGVLVVGYGTDDSSDYWLVKNSWSTMWGEEGYIKMTRNKDNQCGIASQASYPLV
ncbi:procathepsin L-like [Mercenaria mercenaria]|uniref:procathepsin L-like n=1 Tax=Mercenaria mercenaria TaxID=6596 RepID=UPI00234E56D8|nr:procathepsin L-like [Mercenaria mercenaria]XP_053397747.1 procathepsin L-like [Mercenaria mercenaria]XP_053397748.1 procathepsin L-like [Mercenaria mercenaria]